MVLVFGGHGMGCGLMFCWWFLQSVVSAIGGFCNRYLLVVSPIGVVLGLVFIGDWWVWVFFFFFFLLWTGGGGGGCGYDCACSCG